MLAIPFQEFVLEINSISGLTQLADTAMTQFHLVSIDFLNE
jgi:hypothetical protein